MQITARRFDTRQPARFHIADGRIERVEPLGNGAAADTLPWIAPGLIDIQVNGYGGQEFSSPKLTAEKVGAIVREHYAFGVTRICPTLTTQSLETLAHGMRAIAEACESDDELSDVIAGIHLEGPYIARDDGPRGAHPLEHCRPPDWDEFQQLQEAAGGRIALHTLSPEYDEAPEFIARSVATGVTIAIAHTSATGEQIRAAVDAGATLSTHLGNGAHRELRRHPNYIWDQLADDRLMASLIVDGHHLPAEVVKTFVRAKTPARCILVSDESGLAGLPPGRYPSSGGDVEILEDGRLVIAGQTQLLAGASLPISLCVPNVMRCAGVDLATAIDMATLHPARLLHIDAQTLRPGDRADLILFDLPADHSSGPLHIHATLLSGGSVYGTVPGGK